MFKDLGNRAVSMEKSAIREQELKMIAEIKKHRTARVTVTGYDYTLPQADIKRELTKVFSSCGEIVHLSAPIRSRSVRIVIVGEGIKEKALQLNGTASDVGILLVTDVSTNVIPPRDVSVRRDVAVLHSSTKICVSGYDTTLPEDDIKSALANLFSSCGEVMGVVVPRSKGAAFIAFMGEGAKEKAVELNGCDMGGRTLNIFAVGGQRKSCFNPVNEQGQPYIFGFPTPLHERMLKKYKPTTESSSSLQAKMTTESSSSSLP